MRVRLIVYTRANRAQDLARREFFRRASGANAPRDEAAEKQKSFFS